MSSITKIKCCLNWKLGCPFECPINDIAYKEHMQNCVFSQLKNYIKRNQHEKENLKQSIKELSNRIDQLSKRIHKINLNNNNNKINQREFSDIFNLNNINTNNFKIEDSIKNLLETSKSSKARQIFIKDHKKFIAQGISYVDSGCTLQQLYVKRNLKEQYKKQIIKYNKIYDSYAHVPVRGVCFYKNYIFVASKSGVQIWKVYDNKFSFIKILDSKEAFSIIINEDFVIVGHLNYVQFYRINKEKTIRLNAYYCEGEIRFLYYNKNNLFTCSELSVVNKWRVKKMINLKKNILSVKHKKKIIAHDDLITGMDGYSMFLVTVGLDNYIKIWKVKKLELLKKLKCENIVLAICTLLKRKWQRVEEYWLFCGCYNGDICVWNLREFKVEKMIRGHGYKVISLCVSGSLVIFGYPNGYLKIWDGRALRNISTISSSMTLSPARSICVANVDAIKNINACVYIVSGHVDGSLQLYAVE